MPAHSPSVQFFNQYTPQPTNNGGTTVKKFRGFYFSRGSQSHGILESADRSEWRLMVANVLGETAPRTNERTRTSKEELKVIVSEDEGETFFEVSV